MTKKWRSVLDGASVPKSGTPATATPAAAVVPRNCRRVIRRLDMLWAPLRVEASPNPDDPPADNPRCRSLIDLRALRRNRLARQGADEALDAIHDLGILGILEHRIQLRL